MNTDKLLAPNQLNTINIGLIRQLLKKVEQIYKNDKLIIK